REMLREIDKQILPDGADFEASTGYHRLILELLLYTFILCRENDVEIPEQYWTKLHEMLVFARVYLRPDRLAPLIGDSDSGQVLPFKRRRADDHAYLLGIGSVVFKDSRLRLSEESAPEELQWILGDQGVEAFTSMTPNLELETSRAFADAGLYIMRDRDLYLCFNASGAGVHGRGSHGHNDALSIEVSAFGTSFISDPGTFVYGANPEARHAFRSTRYHSTVQIDGHEQNTTDLKVPFVIGNEAQPKVLRWESNQSTDIVVAEHYGYRRFDSPVTHRRTVTFDKKQRAWSLLDEFTGEGEHEFEVRLHFRPELEISVRNSTVIAKSSNGKSLQISSLSALPAAELEELVSSRDYGEKRPSVSACWRIRGRAGRFEWRITPVDGLASITTRN
ncbi:MAG TPA: alginate lyase family protein, partial [Pyrinomonadaceae bacterium]|nr:alginate lyase family protein [Pyrinomonadaceae bacterium]